MEKQGLFFVVMVCLCLSSKAQRGKEEDKQGWPRLGMTTPPFGLEKVRRLIGVKRGGVDITSAMRQGTFDSLSLREKFTYTMIHPERYIQTCGRSYHYNGHQDDLFSSLPSFFDDEYTWSQRQRDFLSHNRDSVVALMKETVAAGSGIGANYKRAIEILGAGEMIPSIIRVYDREKNPAKKDHDLLTTMMVLMRDAKYEFFIDSELYRQLYEYDDNGVVETHPDRKYRKGDDENIRQYAKSFYDNYKHVKVADGWPRFGMSKPGYGLSKVRKLIENERTFAWKKQKAEIAKRKNDTTEDGSSTMRFMRGNLVLRDSVYGKLNTRERFTYNMINPESYSQNCSFIGYYNGDKAKIYSRLPAGFGDIYWSDRQDKFFRSNRDSVVWLIEAQLRQGGGVGLNYKQAIMDAKAVELIPVLMAAYDGETEPAKKDHDILTLMMLLMLQSKYEPFLSSAVCLEFYGEGQRSWARELSFSEERKTAIVGFAMDLYKTTGK